MNNTGRKITTQALVVSAVLLGLGFVLSMLKFQIPLPGVGSITVVSMLPLVILGYKYGPAWGGLCGIVHSLLQLVEGGWYPPPVPGAMASILCFLLDYALAWGAIGLLAGLIGGLVHTLRPALCLCAVVGLAGRYLCSFVSGVLIWGAYAPDGQGAVVYSLVANGSYMIPEIIVTAVISFGLASVPAMRRYLRREVSSSASRRMEAVGE